MTDLSQFASSARSSIGRYFGLVSAVPSFVLVGWTVLLVQSGAWSGVPDVGAAFHGFAELGIVGTAGLVLASLVLGLVMHPMQFAFVQFLEGYWGTSRLASRLRFLRIRAKVVRLADQRERIARLEGQVEDLKERRERAVGDEYDQLTLRIIEFSALRGELERIVAANPEDLEAVMPSRLGNVLRRFEWSVGKAYRLDSITIVPYLSRVAAPGDMEYVNDQRSQLDLAVRMTVVGLIATGLALIFFARHGLWLTVAFIPYAAAYLSYRGAVVAAAAYGRSLGVLMVLNRFHLYERLRLPPLKDIVAERTQNAALSPLLHHDSGNGIVIEYRDDRSPPASDQSSSS